MNKELKTELITAILSSPIVYIRTSHYRYVDEILTEILTPPKDVPGILNISLDNLFEFDLARGVVYFDTKEKDPDSSSTDTLQEFIKNHIGLDKSEPQISLVKNCGKSVLEEKSVTTLLSTVTSKYEEGVYHPLSTIVLVSPDSVENLPREFVDIVKVIELKPPTFEDIESIVKTVPISEQFKCVEDSVRMEFSRNLQGLNLADIRHILRSCLVRTGGRLSRQTINLALNEKKLIVKKSGIIEVVDTDEQLDNVGGLENLKDEIRNKKTIFENLSLAQSKQASVPLPKGVLIIGMPGCGKSMIAKAIASEFGVALLRLDVNRLMGKYVGESETNLRRALEIAEAAHPCVLWIDEIEKAFAGTDSGNNDIIVRLMGHFLTWMQERKSAVYVVATANDTLKPELMRKGRFDDVFYVDFPNKKEAESILRKSLDKYKDASLYNLSGIGSKEISEIVAAMFKESCRGFSGAEISALVGAVISNAFRGFILEQDDVPTSINLGQSVKLQKTDFIKVVETMRKYVMSNQLDDKKPDSAIRRISKLQKEFNLKPASNP